MKLIEHFVGGKIIPGSSDKKGKVYNPATGEQESEVQDEVEVNAQDNMADLDSCPSGSSTPGD